MYSLMLISMMLLKLQADSNRIKDFGYYFTTTPDAFIRHDQRESLIGIFPIAYNLGFLWSILSIKYRSEDGR